MQAILAVTLPFFALVLLGWIAARAHWLPESAVPGLNAYVLFFALPCMLFRFGASLPLRRLADPRQLGVYLRRALAVIALTIAVTVRRAGRADGVDLRDAAFGALVAAFPNAGFMGVPLLVALLGDAAAGPVIGAILVDLVVTSTLCLALAQVEQPPRRRRRALARPRRRCSRCAARSPTRCRGRSRLGAAFAATSRELPAPLAQIVRMLGDSAAPVALFTIGTVLWRAGRHVHTRTPVAPLLAGGADQAGRPPGAGVRDRLGRDRARRGAHAVRADGADPHRGAAEREQRLAPGRALRRRQRPHRAGSSWRRPCWRSRRSRSWPGCSASAAGARQVGVRLRYSVYRVQDRRRDRPARQAPARARPGRARLPRAPRRHQRRLARARRRG